MDSLPDDAPLEDDVPSPRRRRSEQGYARFLYVIVVAQDRIKVGVTLDPEKRLAEHRRLADAFGAESGRHWLSYPGVGTPDNEARLVAFCAERATRQFSREYFSGLDFAEVVEHAEFLSGDNPQRRGRIRNPRAPKRSRRTARLTAFESAGARLRSSGTIAEAARWMDLSQSHIRKLIDSGELRVLPSSGGAERIPVTAMREWLMQ